MGGPGGARPTSRTPRRRPILRALESDRFHGWSAIVVAAGLLGAWTAWFLLARVPLYETSSVARIEAADAAHPVDAQIAGRAVRVNLVVGARVRAGDVLVELDADGERLALRGVNYFRRRFNCRRARAPGGAGACARAGPGNRGDAARDRRRGARPRRRAAGHPRGARPAARGSPRGAG